MTENALDQQMKAELQSTNLAVPSEDNPSDDVDLAMAIDLQRCTGCGACNIACKNENNLEEGVAWSSRIVETEGEFPNVKYEYKPTLCNQCEDAPCAEGCPTSALYKGPGGITMHEPDKCIGCKYCMVNCPYDEIHLKKQDPHVSWEDDEAMIEEGTSSPAELKVELGTDDRDGPANYNPNREVGEHEHPTRYKGVVEKCTFCAHRLPEGELPACVEECPCDARIFGDRSDPDSKISEVLGTYDDRGLKEEQGTEPKVRYVRDYNGGSYERGKGEAALGD